MEVGSDFVLSVIAKIKEKRMSNKLKIIPLGGFDEIGKNMTVIECGKDIIVVDCGLGFPDDDMYGIDIVIPNIGYLVQNKKRIRAVVLTHGHEDHIGAIPYVFREINAPIYSTKLTAGLVELKLIEHKLIDKVTLNTLTAGQNFNAGCFNIEFINVNHSIPDAVGLCITTPIGKIIHTGDFKIDTTPIHGEMIDLARFGELGKEGVLCLMADSTNVEKPGYSDSEKKVGEGFDQYFKGCDKRIIVTTFASNVHRLQQIVNAAYKFKRKVAVTGRSMENVMRVAKELGYIKIPDGLLIDLNRIGDLPKNKLVIITTGSQGESMSALYRMAFSGHRQVEITEGDRVIISASAIPGNEKTVTRVINELFSKGAEVVYEKMSELHVSGHACMDELKMMQALVKPKFFIPVHGEHRHLRKHATLAQGMGVLPHNTVIGETGRIIEVTQKKIKLGGAVTSGKVFVDGTGVGDVGSVVLRDRQLLAQDGMIVVVMTVSAEDGELITPPDIISRGFIYVKESEGLMEEMRRVTMESIESCSNQKVKDWASIKSRVKTNLSGYLYKTTKRSPMIIPVITEV